MRFATTAILTILGSSPLGCALFRDYHGFNPASSEISRDDVPGAGVTQLVDDKKGFDVVDFDGLSPAKPLSTDELEEWYQDAFQGGVPTEAAHGHYGDYQPDITGDVKAVTDPQIIMPTGESFYFYGSATVVCIDGDGAIGTINLVQTKKDNADLIDFVIVLDMKKNRKGLIDFSKKGRNDEVFICGEQVDSVPANLDKLTMQFDDINQGFIVFGDQVSQGVGFRVIQELMNDPRISSRTQREDAGVMAAAMTMLRGHAKQAHAHSDGTYRRWPCRHSSAEIIAQNVLSLAIARRSR